MSEPINPDRAIFDFEFHSGVNLCASFADRYAKHFHKKIGLIPCADGGTNILQWQPGELLFDHAVWMTRLAMRTSNFGGILWHQGESDCNASDFSLYKERAIRMITEIRRVLQAENLPFIFGELAEDISERWNLGDYPAQMNSVFREIQRELPNCRLVSSKGLELKSDGEYRMVNSPGTISEASSPEKYVSRAGQREAWGGVIFCRADFYHMSPPNPARYKGKSWNKLGRPLFSANLSFRR